MSIDMTAIIARMEQAAQDAREALDDFRRAQNDDSDEANADHILRATAGLDDFEGAVGDLVP